MSRTPSAFKQLDVARAIRAAKTAGLHIARILVDPKTAKIELVIKEGDEEKTIDNPFDSAPVHDPAMRKRKSKTPC